MPACWNSAGGAMRLRQDDFTPERLAAEIARACQRAAKARSNGGGRPLAGRVDAAERLADLVHRRRSQENGEGTR